MTEKQRIGKIVLIALVILEAIALGVVLYFYGKEKSGGDRYVYMTEENGAGGNGAQGSGNSGGSGSQEANMGTGGGYNGGNAGSGTGTENGSAEIGGSTGNNGGIGSNSGGNGNDGNGGNGNGGGNTGTNGGTGNGGNGSAGNNGGTGNGGNGSAGNNGGTGNNGNTGNNGGNGNTGNNGSAGNNGDNGSAGNNGGTGNGGNGSTATSGGYYGALKVTNGRLTDSSGKPVQLKGVSTHGLSWFPEYVNADTIAYLHSQWNINLFRLAMYTAEGGYCEGGADQQKKLKNLIDTAVKETAKNDMYVIIDWHVLHDLDPNKYKDQAKEFFAEMSKKYSGYDHVIYEICNEPNGGTSWDSVKKYAEEVIPVIRANDKDAVILVGTPTWCQDIDQAQRNPITKYDNLMYTFHYYAGTHKEDLRNRVQTAVSAGIPVFISEFGICDASGNGGIDVAEADKWMELINKNGLSCAQWSLCNKDESASILKSGCKSMSGWTQNDLTESGKWMVKNLGNGKFSAPEHIDTGSSGGNGGSSGGGNGNNGGNNGGNGDNNGGSNGNNGGNSGNNGGNGGSNNGGNNGNTGSTEVKLPAPVTDASGATVSAQNGWSDDKGKTCIQFKAELTNKSGKASSSWTLVITFDKTVTVNNGWNGKYETSGSKLTITSEEYNGKVEAGASASDVGFILESDGDCTIKSAVVTWK